jgi:hypothetical protein
MNEQKNNNNIIRNNLLENYTRMFNDVPVNRFIRLHEIKIMSEQNIEKYKFVLENELYISIFNEHNDDDYITFFNIFDKYSFMGRLLDKAISNPTKQIIILAPGDSPSKPIMVLDYLFSKILNKYKIKIIQFPLSSGGNTNAETKYLHKIMENNDIDVKDAKYIFGFVDAISMGTTSEKIEKYLDIELSGDIIYGNIIEWGNSVFDVAESVPSFYNRNTRRLTKLGARCVPHYKVGYNNLNNKLQKHNYLFCNLIILLLYHHIFSKLKYWQKELRNKPIDEIPEYYIENNFYMDDIYPSNDNISVQGGKKKVIKKKSVKKKNKNKKKSVKKKSVKKKSVKKKSVKKKSVKKKSVKKKSVKKKNKSKK